MSKISILVDPMSPKLIFCENTCFSRHFGIFTTLVATLLMIIETHELTLHRGPRPGGQPRRRVAYFKKFSRETPIVFKNSVFAIFLQIRCSF